MSCSLVFVGVLMLYKDNIHKLGAQGDAILQIRNSTISCTYVTNIHGPSNYKVTISRL